MLEQATPIPNSPTEEAASVPQDQDRGPMAGIGELAAFLFAGAGAILRFFAPQHEALEAEIEQEPTAKTPEASAVDRVDELAAKIAPFPAQDG